jgi:DNA-binding response OmpR family regulator
MPKQDGFVTFWELRKDDKTKHIPVVFLTGIRQTLGARFSKEVVGDLVGEEPDYYLEKPINPEKLQDIVKEVLGHKAKAKIRPIRYGNLFEVVSSFCYKEIAKIRPIRYGNNLNF